MPIDPKKHFVLIKGEDKTEDVLHVTRKGERTAVTFQNGKSYHYSPRNVEWLSNPVRIPIEDARLSISGDILSDVDEALRFGSWVKIFHKAGPSRYSPFAALSVQQMKIPDGRSKDLLAYFRELAEGSTLRGDDNEPLLAMKYRHLSSVSGDSILSGFLRGSPPSTKPGVPEPTSQLIFPFGCNMSQKMAVEAAIQNPASLIQGPPGTGKTQTILNLIANLLLKGKYVAVVSNNNSATSNVLEKLRKPRLDFIAAFLGSIQNKEAFINGQGHTTVQMPTLSDIEHASVREDIRRLNHELDKAYKTKNDLAVIIQKIDALQLELTHFEKFLQETEGYRSKTWNQEFGAETSSQVIMKYWLMFERMGAPSSRKPAQTRPDQIASPMEIIASSLNKALRFCQSLLERFRILLRFGLTGRTLFKRSIEECILIFQKAYYQRKIEELERTRQYLETSLEGFHFEKRLKQLTTLSMQLFKHHLAGRYNNRERKFFNLDSISRKPDEFLGEYPVVLSTTFSVITSVTSSYLYDCVIVDEASQVDLLNGVLAMGCAKKIVIVGDPMQLPNVLTEEDRKRAERVVLGYDVPEYARFERHNLLSAVHAAFPGIPNTLLREHYRCHPKIIDFCNQKFYDGELLVMTSDRGEPDVLKAYVTVEGRHARGTFNQRQIDEIIHTVLPDLEPMSSADIGIVAPYRMQASRMKASIGPGEIEVDTVHKYQGREKRVMVITTVANEANAFVDNPNLLNVAISRAQDKLRLVVSEKMAEGDGNIAGFVRYIRYRNCEVIPGKVRSVFDLLYGEYTQARMKLLKTRRRISQYDSENLVYGEIEAVLQEETYRGHGVVTQFPLSMLVQSAGHLTTEESDYATHPWAKTDFLIYRKVDKSPVLVIEADGYAFHREGTRQAERDALKDSVLKKCGLAILRLSTVESNERDRIRKKLEEVVG
jgi:hypothetical protein